MKAKSDPQGSTKLAFVTGIFVGLIAATGAFLLWPSVSAPEPYLEDVGQFAEKTSQRVTETIDWSFYDLFPKAEVATVGGYQQPMAMVGDATLTYYLQVGSFPTTSDADQRRAELLLLGLSPSVEQKQIEQTTWHRIMLGPFESEVELNRTQAVLAANEFESMPLTKRAPPSHSDAGTDISSGRDG
ncbi:MAG: SPOR domain-containing protein [Pseudomonadota bacterium]|nr:SPOR domain-containing protein [Pseudomonadota bacterium]